MKSKLFVGAILIWALCNGCTKDKEDKVQQNDIAAVDTKVSNWVTTYNIPGASLAISRNGKLVYRKGFGVADQTTNQALTTDMRFRLASVSKTITAAAIMKLVQGGSLSLDQKVFGTGAILGTTYGTKPYTANIQNITVRHLLQHTAGGWNNSFPGDPVFTNPGYTPQQLITWTLDNKALTHAPGSSYQYSNFGYLVLARIIEKVSSKTYVEYVRSEILNPLGATATELAGNTPADRKQNEVRYYGQGNEAGYVYTDPWNRNDGPAGWISTPTDLLRFMTAIDSFPSRPDFLSTSTLNLMRTPGPANAYYGLGINVEKDPVHGTVWYHYGSLPGTTSIIFGTSSGFNVAFVANSRFTNWSAASNAMASMLVSIVSDNAVPWQDIDQF